MADGVAILEEDEVQRIAAMSDPVARNVQITDAYRRLSLQLRGFIGGPYANWCTYGVWSSRTVGGALAARDVPIRAKHLLARLVPIRPLRNRLEARLRRGLPRTRTTYAVPLADGNRDIFLEIGSTFTRFLATLSDHVVADEQGLEDFLATVEGDLPLPGMDEAAPSLMREGFRSYYRARYAETADERSELVLAGSLLVGAYEQRRVQDRVAQSFELGVVQFLGRLGRIGPLRRAVTPIWARLMTKEVMSLVIDGDTISLGEAMKPPPGATSLYPPNLTHVDLLQLTEILARYDPHPSRKVVARDWSNFDDRMRYITAFFRSRQQEPELFAKLDETGKW